MSRNSRRRGFTLIEVLTVVGIMALLAGLISVFALSGITTTQIRITTAEIGRLAASLEKYKAEFGEYPPNMGSLDPNHPRADRFEEHLRMAYPRFARGADYDSLKARIARDYRVKVNGRPQPLNLDYLDQAEALVFWLGGMPTPLDATGNPAASTKLFGFSNDKTNPFKRDASAARSDRTIPHYDFDEGRLVDHDGDGWWEFTPRGTSESNGGRMPPYVYFDAPVYTATVNTTSGPTYAGYPSVGYAPASPGSMSLLQEWGLAIPYASAVKPGQLPIRWINPKSFQIICAGLDSTYGEPGVQQVRLSIYPGNATFRGATLAKADTYDVQEKDNLTNFADSQMDDINPGEGDADTLALVAIAKPAQNNTTSSSSSTTTTQNTNNYGGGNASGSGGGGGGTGLNVNTGS